MTRWQRFIRALPLTLALAMTAVVWAAGAVWSFEEQTRFAASQGFAVPQLLPLVLDGLAVALAGVAYAASLAGRAAVQARLGTALAVAASASSNAAWAWSRTAGDHGAVVLAAGVPVAANIAFEVLLAELRRQVHRSRGLPAPVAVPGPRLIRLALAPSRTWREWRALVLDLTAMPAPAKPDRPPRMADPEPVTSQPAEPEPIAGKPRRRSISEKPQRTSLDDLLPVAQQVAQHLTSQGKRVSRRALIHGLRERGHTLSTDRAGELLTRLAA